MRKTAQKSMAGNQSTPREKVGLVKCVGTEIQANFEAWFKRNFADGRIGRIGTITYSRAGALDDHVGDGTWYADALGRAYADYSEPATPDEIAYVISHPLIAFQLCAGITDIRGLRCLRRGLTQRVNALQQRAYRSRYYARDNARRRLLAAERRKIRRRSTLNPCPSPEAFRAAFAQVGESVAAKIRFGGLVHDLECYVDNCLRIDESGEIVGRNGGIKAWIGEHVPELYGRYKTIMRYKALAKRVRQVAQIDDPVPTDLLLEEREVVPAQETTRAHNPAMKTENSSTKNYYADKSHLQTLRMAREKAGELLKECDNAVADVFRRVDARLQQMEDELKPPEYTCSRR